MARAAFSFLRGLKNYVSKGERGFIMSNDASFPIC